MQELLTFLIYTLLFWFAGACMLKLFTFAIQPGQILDKIFNWQAMLKKMYESKYARMQLLGKVMGDCDICVTYWFMFFWFWCYFMFLHLLNFWFITKYIDNIFASIIVNIIWYFLFQSIGTIGTVTQLFKFKRIAKKKAKENAV